MSTVFPALALLGDDLLEQQPRAQVESFHRLVEDEQIRLGEHGLRQGEALDHSLAEAGDRFVGTVRQSHRARAARARGFAGPRREIPDRSP